MKQAPVGASLGALAFRNHYTAAISIEQQEPDEHKATEGCVKWTHTCVDVHTRTYAHTHVHSMHVRTLRPSASSSRSLMNTRPQRGA